MIWVGIGIALVLSVIGGTMLYDGDNPLTRIMGLIVTLIAGVVLGFSVPLPGWLGYQQLDHGKCVYYVYSEDARLWNCVPREEAG